MKKLFTVLLLLVVGCSVAGKDVSAFEGHISAVKTGGLEVECSNVVNQNDPSPSSEEGWACLVLVPHDTPVQNTEGESIPMDEFREQARNEEMLYIRVTLEESTNINKDPESRKLTAKKITLLE
ncbi:hypothetical protein [Halobacillus karajensis]|uniref:Lipoprotein n=1 Tax=Halobacillus karajensis TaxID=195088 RepID=A0A024P613_9BACI|nr:hypothetical protein [Halobacillus karajensis]CDQ17775.1 hypothetical protein BN982_00013 [Halobacillus karajensis]CDQ24183.1 hypothetical protein BN983_02452 [Halobacillus karajensis]CDQ29570.1 hypothetical protein BN981_03953 [Halobacillus karajensis]